MMQTAALSVLLLASLVAVPPAAEGPVLCNDTQPLLELAPEPLPMGPAYCEASCGGYTISCTGSSCSAQDRNCPSAQGFVQCDGSYTWCTPTCPECTEGTIQIIGTGDCCPYPQIGEEKIREKCINGHWTYMSTVCRFSPLCPFIP